MSIFVLSAKGHSLVVEQRYPGRRGDPRVMRVLGLTVQQIRRNMDGGRLEVAQLGLASACVALGWRSAAPKWLVAIMPNHRGNDSRGRDEAEG